ncbi:YbgC/FadM family acyl-CoA thioesterase [Gammaproteobacteria bacterium]|jgi:acyl-CoA thioester hydrolase|nr:YbgC/FadM family acyl-CoA thioesterase [Gammaproteobacteria bacterium]|tara:strand:+ start:1021 stop:1428 length:408 start_codon:yes stop_codon:yes gene_type:complete
MKKDFKCNDFPLTVFCEDTDFQGIVYHANYLKYFERARTQFLIDQNISQISLASSSLAFVIRDINLRYLTPAKLEDKLVVSSSVQCISRARLLFSQQIINPKNDTIICRGEIEVCFLDLSKNKPKSFPENLLKIF